MSVNEYVTKFTQLSRYAPHEVDTDEKKQDYFLNGLNDGLAYALEAQDFEKFKGMVNKALVLENRRGVMEHKRKLVRQHQSGSSSRSRVVTSSTRPMSRHAQPQYQPRPQLSYPILQAKPSTHPMYDPRSIVPHIRTKRVHR
jgi:hypothetical protein